MKMNDRYMERLTEKIGNTNCVKGCGSNCKYGFQHCRTEDWENCKAIDDIKEKLMQNGFIYTQHALDVFNEIAEQLKAGGTE